MTDADGRKYVQDAKGNSVKGVVVMPPDLLIGDVNGDKIVNAQDATKLLVAAALSGNSTDLTTQQALLKENQSYFETAERVLSYADVNGDGVINAKDATVILIYAAALGVDSTTPALGAERYFAGADGFLQSGFVKDEASGAYYFADENGKIQSGWQTVLTPEGTAEKRYFLNDGKMAVNQSVPGENGGTVKVDENGCPQKSGFYDSAEGRYYQDDNGQRVTGLQKIGDNTYYFNESGIMQKGFITVNGNSCYADENGIVRAGLVKVGNDSYYFDVNTFAKQTSVMLTFPDGDRYFDEEGRMVRGWKTLGDNKYWFDDNGIKAVGKKQIGEFYYWFDASGVNGTGWIENGTERYFCDPTDRYMYTGWHPFNGFLYYFYADGTLATNTVIDNRTIQANGVAMSNALMEASQKIQNGMANYQKDPEGIYQYMRATNAYKHTEATKTLEELNAYGWGNLVVDAVNTRYVVCYYMAAKMDFIFRMYGYNSRIVHATHGSGDHYWNQVQMPGGNWVDYDPTNGGWKGYSYEQIMSVGNFTFLGYVIPEYY